MDEQETFDQSIDYILSIISMDISRSDFALLLSLNVLLEEASVTRACARLGLSQPALSAQLGRLRDIFGDPLLVPSGRKLVRTARAEALRKPLAEQLEALQILIRQQAAFDPASAKTTISILAPDHLHAFLSARIGNGLRQDAPGIRMAMLPAPREAAESWDELETGRSDFLITSVRLTPPEAIAVTLYEERFVIAQRRGHPRGLDAPDIDEYCTLDHLLISTSGGSFEGPVDKTLKAQGKARNVVMSVPSFLAAPLVLQSSDMVCTMPVSVGAMHGGGLDLLPLPIEQPGFPVLLSWHPKRHGDPAHHWMKAQIVEKAQAIIQTL